jgi:hypothetical protein
MATPSDLLKNARGGGGPSYSPEAVAYRQERRAAAAQKPPTLDKPMARPTPRPSPPIMANPPLRMPPSPQKTSPPNDGGIGGAVVNGAALQNMRQMHDVNSVGPALQGPMGPGGIQADNMGRFQPGPPPGIAAMPMPPAQGGAVGGGLSAFPGFQAPQKMFLPNGGDGIGGAMHNGEGMPGPAPGGMPMPPVGGPGGAIGNAGGGQVGPPMGGPIHADPIGQYTPQPAIQALGNVGAQLALRRPMMPPNPGAAGMVGGGRPLGGL